ncbi:MAG: sigma-70 family RNA polymerase sigma factor, partial [Planctomycetota bacterium]
MAVNPEELLIHKEFVHALARSLVWDEHRAADIAQETWLAALKHPPSREIPLRAWLAKVTLNFARKFHVSDKRRAAREKAGAIPEGMPSPQEIASREEARRRMVEAVLDLKEPYRSTVLLRYYENLPISEVALRFDLPEGTVKTRLKRGLEKLKEKLDAGYQGDRKRWCLALAPLAGLSLPEASAISLTAAIKACLVLAAAATLILSVTLIPDWDEPSRIEEDPADQPLAMEMAEKEAAQAEGTDREPLPPISDSLEMPSAFRKALVGYQGRVVDERGEPLPEKAVRIYPLSPLDLFGSFDVVPRTTITAEDGAFCIEDLDPRSYCFLQAAGEGIRFLDIQPNPGEISDLGDVVVMTGNVLTGRIQDVEGNPLQGVRIRATQLPPLIFSYAVQDIRKGGSILFEQDPLYQKKCVLDLPEMGFNLLDALPFPSAITAKDGSFRLTALPSGPITLVADKQGFMSKSAGTMVSSRKKEHEIKTMTMEQGALIQGHVLDDLNLPVPGAEIRMGQKSGNPIFSILQPPMTANGEGFFFANVASPDLTHAAIRRSPKDPWFFPDPFFPESTEMIFHLPPTTEVQVKTGAENATVKIREKTFQIPQLPYEFHDLESLDGLFPGMYELRVTAPGYSPAYKTITLGDSPITLRENPIVVEMALERAFEAAVEVKAAEENTPLAWAEVFAMPEGSDLFRETSKLRRGRTDASGCAHIQDLAPGRYVVTVSHPGYALTTTNLDVPKQATIDVTMKAGGILEGKVHLQGTFTLILECLAGHGYPEFVVHRFFVTDQTGCFHVANLHPGMWKVNVMGRLFGKRPLELFEMFLQGPLAQRVVEIRAGETRSLDIVPDEPSRNFMGAVSGSVLLDGIPVKGVEVNLEADGKLLTSVTDVNGVYALSQVPPGSHCIEARIPPELKLERKILVEEDLPFHEDFHLFTGTLFGQVIAHSDGRPLGGVQVKAWVPMDTSPLEERLRQAMAGNTTGSDEAALSHLMNTDTIPIEMKTTTRPDGTFRFEKAPEGVYHVMTEKTGFGNQRMEAVQAKRNADTGPVIIKVRSPVMVQGRVELPQEIGENHDLTLIITPVEGKLSWLALRALLEECLFVLVDKKTNTFEIKNVVPGRYKVSFNITSYNQSKRWAGKSIEPMKIEVL